MDAKRRKYPSRQNKIHDARNIGILNIEFYMNVFLRGTGCFQKSLLVVLFILPLYNAFK